MGKNHCGKKGIWFVISAFKIVFWLNWSAECEIHKKRLLWNGFYEDSFIL